MQYAAWVPRRSAVQATGNVVGIPFLPMLQVAACAGSGRVTLPRFPDVLRIRRNPSQKNAPFPVPGPHRRLGVRACLFLARNHNSGVASLASKSRRYERPSKRGIPRFPKEFIPNYSCVFEHDGTLDPGRAPSILPENETDPPWYDLDMSLDDPTTPFRRLRPGDLVPRSTQRRSYNLLIDLSIRHKSFGISMSDEGIDHNHITHKLLLRWLLYTNRRAEAWRLLEELTAPSASAPLPVAYWLEFFHSSRRTPLSNTEFLHLMKISPVRLSESTSPRVMSVVIRAILRLGRPLYALQLVTTYLTGMPRKVNAVLVRQNMKLVNLVVCYGSTEKGIKRFFASRQTLQALLALHPTLRPTPATLLILLSQLWGCKRAGRIASQLVEEFKDRWGCEVENAEVRQRVASLALKDVRLRGISPKILQTIEESASASQSGSGGCGVARLRYVPHFWTVSGVEERRRWRRLHRLYRRRTRGLGATGRRVSIRSRGRGVVG
ncbi:hypothetical protein EDD18DRAFT_1122994 [Armillaria luteobubalina]|uniref:Uncharacterized protein n=1 Tax=Armillaria luteobubalina TaxID=153913 RepID=A0AA39QR15_9AGAR|nr:hypothetical protein EDD18DRAFT_1122994 [Armillaria luteobubalina]